MSSIVSLQRSLTFDRTPELRELRVFKANFDLCAKRFHSAHVPNHIQPVKQEKGVLR